MNSITGLHQLGPLLKTVASRLKERHRAQHAPLYDGMPDYLLADIGLPGFHDLSDVARRAAVLEALRRF